MEKYMSLNIDDFFYEATLRICSSLDLKIMLSNCFSFLREKIPAVGLGMDIYDLEAQTVEDIAYVSELDFDLNESVFRLSPEAIDYIRDLENEDPMDAKFIVNRPKNNPITKIFWEALGNPEMSYIFSLLHVANKKIGVISLWADGYDRYTFDHLKMLNLLNGPFAISLSNALQHREVLQLKEQLIDDNRYLNQQLHQLAGDEIVGHDFGLSGVMNMVRQVAHLPTQVLLLGETGVGKEVIANAIHYASPRSNGPFIKVNCGAIPASLMDSELFGHEKGAFTGASQKKRGKFERADGGTIFLDEIGELPLEAQVRLLRVIQMLVIERVGGTKQIPVDIRIIAATHRDLEDMVDKGLFRKDLLFRLNVFPINIPPLRERIIDLPALVSFFIKRKSKDLNLGTPKIPAPGSIEKLKSYSWPGNIRELENIVERALIRNSSDLNNKYLYFDDLVPEDNIKKDDKNIVNISNVLSIDDAMINHIESVLQLTNGKIQGKDGAAALLGMPPSTLRNRMRKLGITFGKR
jgi:transcriptional regulator with GAF, ATPase, and Fis domain